MSWIGNIHLKICLLNAENLFLLFDHAPAPEHLKLDETQWQKLSTSIYENKPLSKTHKLAKLIKEIDPDILMLCEVGGLESLKNFNSLFLDSNYSPCLLEGNSDRNIDVGYLIKKNQPFYFDLHSNRNRPINYAYAHEKESHDEPPPHSAPSNRFARDVAELRLFFNDREKPFLIFLLAHLKSRLDKDKVDPNGFERRRAETRTLVEIYKEQKKLFKNAPIVVAGDFNGNASIENTEEEFKILYEQTDLKDVFSIENIPSGQRATYYQVKSGSRSEGKQIDYCFLCDLAQKNLVKNSSRIYRYKDEYGFDLPTPNSMEDKLSLPSDHYPIIFELKI